MSDLQKAKRLANIANLKVKEYKEDSKATDDNLVIALKSACNEYKDVSKNDFKDEDADQFMQVIQNLVSCQQDMKKYDDALTTLNEALRCESLADKDEKIKELKIIVLISKAIGLSTDLNGNADVIISCATEGINLDNDNKPLHYLRAQANYNKGELEAAIQDYKKASGLSDDVTNYAKDTVKAILTKLAIDHIKNNNTFDDFVNRSEIGNSGDAFLKSEELAERVEEYACYEYHNGNKSIACKLANALIGQCSGAKSELYNMASCGKASSELLGQIYNSTDDPLSDSEFNSLDWS